MRIFDPARCPRVRGLVLLTAWAVLALPLVQAHHRLTVLHRWCQEHGHLIEVQPAPQVASAVDPGLHEAIRPAPLERPEVGCTILHQERRADTTPLTATARRWTTVLASGLLPGWPVAERALSVAPKRGPPPPADHGSRR